MKIFRAVCSGFLLGIGFCVWAAESGDIRVILNVDNSIVVSPTPLPLPGSQQRLLQPADYNPPQIIVPGIKIGLDSVTASWNTDEVALCRLFLKLADSGKEGFSEDDFRQSHSAQFTGLTPETHYNFQVECRDRSGNISVTSNFEFTTLSGRDMISPPNVGYFEATGADRMVRLSWLNPDDPDFEGVVITRNTLFYPRNVFDGLVVYDGKSFALSDFNVTANQTYYYAAFSYDKVGNFSSGAIALATTPSIFGAASTSTSVYLRGLSINDFELWQGGRLLVMSSGKAFRVKAREPLKVVFPGKEAAETPKAITVSLGNDSQSFSIILKENAQGTGYEGWIITPAELENASLLIKVFDFENQEQKSISYDLVVVDGAKADNLGWQIATGLALVIVIAAAAFLLKILVRV